MMRGPFNFGDCVSDGDSKSDAAHDWQVRQIVAEIGDGRFGNASPLHNLFKGWSFYRLLMNSIFISLARRNSAALSRPVMHPVRRPAE